MTNKGRRLAVSALFIFVAFAATHQAASAQMSSDVPLPESENSSNSIHIRHGGRVVLDIVEPSGTVVIFDTADMSATPRIGHLPEAILADYGSNHSFILFESQDTMANLKPGLKQVLMNQLDKGKWIIGLEGSDAQLKSDLGLLPSELQDAVSDSTAMPGAALYLYRNPAGILNELVLPAPDRTITEDTGSDNRESLSMQFDQLNEWYTRSKAMTVNANDPWNAIQNYQWDGTTNATYRGNSEVAGSYRFTLSPYWLNSDQNGKDWYRVDYQTYSFITNYEMTGNKFGNTSGNCGWFTNNQHAAITITTPGGTWWQFMPSTTVGSTNVSFTIGGNITTNTVGVTGAYSKSYGIPDVTITVTGSAVDHGIRWASGLKGCGDYSWYPAYSGASGPAKSTYNLDPSLIAYVPHGAPLEFKTSNTNGDWNFRVEKDRVSCGFLCATINVTRYYTTYFQNRRLRCTKNACVLY